MPLVVGVNSDICAVVTGDSRVTTRWPTLLTIHVDCCQKVFRIGDATIVGLCGDLIAIADILGACSHIYQLRPDLTTIEKHFERLPIALRIRTQESRRRLGYTPEVGLIVAGRNSHGTFEMFLCESPNFQAQLVRPNNVVIMGSGSAIVEPVRRDFQKSLPHIMKPLRPFDEDNFAPVAATMIGWSVGDFVERRLKKSGISSVGRAFHTVYVDRNGVWRATYDTARMIGVDKKELIVGTRIDDRGRWIQYSGDGTEIELVNPIDVISDEGLLIKDRTIEAFK